MKVRHTGNVVALPPEHRPTPQEIALDQLEDVYRFFLCRRGNRPDAEDLNLQVTLKAVPRLDPDASRESVHAYLLATARTELAKHWAGVFGLPREPFAQRILHRLPKTYSKVLELRFLRNFSAKGPAREMGTTAGNVRIMQLRALRAAAQVQIDDRTR
ncbi:MAG: RNA polymerase subunit sigma [Candidatus Dormibacteraceae bacterium]